jgi:hypothetical protein
VESELIKLIWWRCIDGYQIDQLSPGKKKGHFGSDGLRGSALGAVRSRSERFECYEPLRLPDSALFDEFAKAPATASGMCKFADVYGLPSLGSRVVPPAAGRPTVQAVSVALLLQEHRELRRAVSFHSARMWAEFERAVNARTVACWHELRANAAGSFQRVFVVSNLIDGMWLQLCAHATSGSLLLRCQRCSKPFLVSADTKRRRTRKWCSDRCKMQNYHKKEA